MGTDEEQAVLSKLKKERTQLRRLYAIAAKKFQEELDQADSFELLEEQFAVYTDKASRLFSVEDRVSELIILCESDEAIAKEYDFSETYRDTHATILSKWGRIYKRDDDERSSSGASSLARQKGKPQQLKLPKIVPFEFDGQLKNWISFWSIFKRIHESSDYDDGEKFQYLLMYTAKESPARELVASFPPLPENYGKAIDRLKARFGRDELLIELYVRELLSLVLLRVKNEGHLRLSKLYDQLETQISALDSLGVASDKYTYLLTPLIESALPDHILRDWERELSKTGTDKTDLMSTAIDQLSLIEGPGNSRVKTLDSKLQRLLSFLRREVESEERMSLARSIFSTPKEKSIVMKRGLPVSQPSSSDFRIENKLRPQTAAGLVNVKSQNLSCLFCDGQRHSSENCIIARNRPLDELRQIVRDKGHCFQCLKQGHSRRLCKSVIKCILCNSSHYPLLCTERKNLAAKDGGNTRQNPQLEQNLHNSCHNAVLMQTLRVRVKGTSDVTARVLFDSGSQRSYVTKSLIAKLNVVPTGEVKLEHALFGGSVTQPKAHKCYKIRLESLNRQYSCNFDVLDSENICVAIPSVPAAGLLQELRNENFEFTDLHGGPIDILIGADVMGKLLTGMKRDLESGLTAVQTHLGWTLMGKIPETEPRFMSHINLFTADFSPQDMWRLDAIGIEDSAQVTTREQQAEQAKAHFLDSLKILDSGRYEVKLPWSGEHPPLPRNFNLALKRFESTSRKLKASASTAQYFGVFRDWLEAGIIEEIPSQNWDVGHYLPHRPVFKEGSTTPIRPVFDASAKEKGRPSLNQCLEVGPNLVEMIPSVLLRFRLGRIGLISDVKKAFLQISLDPADRDFLRFLWKDDDGQLRIFRHARVVFGVCSSPFLLGATFEHHLETCQQKIKNGLLPFSPDVVEKLKQCLYVDNYVGSHESPVEVDTFIEQATSLLAIACFELRGWTYSNDKLPDHTRTPVLGLIWDEKDDTLKINVPQFNDVKHNEVTKKILLSANHRIFDPVGFTAPITVIPKRLFQETWIAGGDWDSPIDEKSQKIFHQWASEIQLLDDVRVPRCVVGCQRDEAELTLHTFCDASQLAYAAVVFLRVEWPGGVNVQLVAAKTRVAPLLKVTIPRLELLAALVGARLADHVLGVLSDVKSTTFYSDSSTSLAWIKQEEPWAVFVRNRVQEIRRLSNPDDWRHIPGADNPADLPSRGCFPRQLVESKWWEGPRWLYLPESDWPQDLIVETDENEVMKERMKKAVVTCLNAAPTLKFLTERMSQYWKIVKVVGWIVRFSNNSRGTDLKKTERLSMDEILNAEKLIIQLVQNEAFTEQTMTEINKLKPHRTEDGLLRVTTKIWARDDTEDFRSPIILPSNHPIVEKLILHEHSRNGHIVGQHLLNVLRERFWIVKGRRTVRRILSGCLVCKRHSAKNLQIETPPLPRDRVRDACVFEVVGTDYAGPLFLSDGSKVWVCLFTCAIYRAIHLELVTSLTTESLMLAFRRFVARRGRPAVVYSDNGTNYRGMQNLLNTVNWNKISDSGAVHRIDWRFSPPSAPWWGGFWERMVRTLKVLLRKNLGHASLCFEELNTVICDCESWINSRPITYVSEDSSEPTPITPQMFLHEIRGSGVPDCDQIDMKMLNRKLKHRQTVQTELRRRFRLEYLGQLQQTSTFKNTRRPKVGELVLIGSEAAKRLDWPLGVIEDVITGRDGEVRVVQVRTADGKLTRPIQRIFPLELSTFADDTYDDVDLRDDTPLDETVPTAGGVLPDSPGQVRRADVAAARGASSQDSPGKICAAKTRCGRKVNLPVRFR